MCELCDLNSGEDGFILTMCSTCNVPMVILREHRATFTEDEKARIGEMFRGAKIRWEQRKITDHAHCHIFWEK